MNNKAYFAVLIGAALAGTSGLLIKLMTIPATSIAFIRMAVPTMFLAWWMYHRKIHFFRGNYKKMLLASLLNAARMYLFLVAYIYTSISNAVIMLFTWPIFVNLMGALWLKESISRKQFILLMLAFSGIVIIYSNQDLSFANDDFIGMTAMLFSAMLYSVSYIIYKTEIQNYHRNEVIFYQNFLGGIIFFPFILINGIWPTAMDWTLALTYATVMGILIFNFFFYGLKYLPASKASALGYFEIISAVLTGIIFMNETLTLPMIIGGSLIVISIMFLRRA